VVVAAEVSRALRARDFQPHAARFLGRSGTQGINNVGQQMSYAIEFPATPTLPVAESNKVFPVGRIYCVGRNYAEHAREMGHDPNREPPFFFMKAASSVVQSGSTIGYPVQTKDVHHEIEMVVAIGKGGKNIPVEKALEHVWGYGVGL